MYPKPTLILAILTVMSACDSEEPGHHAARPMLTPAEIACDHLEFGPFVTVSLDAGEASIEPHTRSDVALAEMEEARLTIEPGMAGVVYFMIDQDLPLKLLDPAGREVAVEPVDLTACDRAAVGDPVVEGPFAGAPTDGVDRGSQATLDLRPVERLA